MYGRIDRALTNTSRIQFRFSFAPTPERVGGIRPWSPRFKLVVLKCGLRAWVTPPSSSRRWQAMQLNDLSDTEICCSRLSSLIGFVIVEVIAKRSESLSS